MNCPIDRESIRMLLGTLKALTAWFQGAHHVAKGDSFVGDHCLYGEIYDALNSDFDTFASMLSVYTDKETIRRKIRFK